MLRTCRSCRTALARSYQRAPTTFDRAAAIARGAAGTALGAITIPGRLFRALVMRQPQTRERAEAEARVAAAVARGALPSIALTRVQMGQAIPADMLPS
jgi:hypothetical protein